MADPKNKSLTARAKGMATGFVLRNVFTKVIPHHVALGLEILSIKGPVAVGKVPWREDLVGDPRTGVVHGGIITTLLDALGGTAVLGALGKAVPLATLDLRIDYLKPAPPKETIYGRVECYRLTKHVAFVRGTAYTDEKQPVASCSATYMLRTQTSRRDREEAAG